MAAACSLTACICTIFLAICSSRYRFGDIVAGARRKEGGRGWGRLHPSVGNELALARLRGRRGESSLEDRGAHGAQDLALSKHR